VETSIGLDRMFLASLSHALREETVPDADGNESTRTVLKLNPAMAPIKCAVLPLVKNKSELTERAKNLFDDIKFVTQVQYDEKDAIGRRYRRQDAIGTPYCLTVDFESLDDGTVTIRERDSLVQERISITSVKQVLAERIDFESLLRQVG
ncbi:MAG: His/Gly/Thr/Pro-type tRNA ligase C-terminal domain-containing protein, partial [Saprospiraceae bacterium]|nr:His/Gly/Thr/Pro-type tRNA ligase C-terminal domain-containing protein [Saprospiraceae bacterium]